MAKLPNYNGTIDLISGLRPKNNGTFPLMQAHDVQATETQRLDEMFKNPESWLPVYDGENEGGAEGGGTGGGNYVLELSGESGTLTDEQYQAVVDNFPNVVVSLTDLGLICKPSANMGDGFVFSLLQPNDTTSLSGGILLIGSDKTYELITIQYTIPPSSGGLTKTKVTLAELQAMITEAVTEAQSGTFDKMRALEGTFVIFSIKFEKMFAGEVTEDMLLLSECPSLTFKYGDPTGWSAFFTVPSATDGTTNGEIRFVSIRATINDTASIYIGTIIIKSDGTITSGGAGGESTLFTDDNFDFYIYK